MSIFFPNYGISILGKENCTLSIASIFLKIGCEKNRKPGKYAFVSICLCVLPSNFELHIISDGLVVKVSASQSRNCGVPVLLWLDHIPSY
jgi:hypothetical protein